MHLVRGYTGEAFSWFRANWRVCLLTAMLAYCRAGFSQGASLFSYEELRSRARKLATEEYRPETNPQLPEFLKKLSYDDYQKIRFIPTQGPWQSDHLRFTFQLFHRGFIYVDPVRMHLVEAGHVRDFQFSARQFDYRDVRLPEPLSADLQFAGVRVLYPMNSLEKQDEVASFLGASYFRLIGAQQDYGASFRGLAIDTAEPSGEEFPRFTDFWIEKPSANDTSVRLFGLLDSASVAGAYRFVIQPGKTARIEVEASLFFRKAVKKLGTAAITSMFFFGENRTRFVPDFRPEVHDSDGLLIQTNAGQCLWRPLVNPEKEHVVTQFPVSTLGGFGLLQRDRQFDHYQDLAGRYERRPSLWVQPGKGWGPGTVELVEIPSPNEWNDNIVAYWVPQEKPSRGQEFRCQYTLLASSGEPEESKLLRVEATRIAPEHDKAPPRFVVDFTAKGVASPAADAPVEASVYASRGSIRNLVTEKNEVTGGWRCFFDLADAGNDPVELGLFLHKGSEVLSETWSYHYQQP
jgi:glucans biosynthesis protein